ncbi:MAG: DsrE/DsrF/DrsH-like family protein [Bacteroidota bacterium]|nr:DsrE/DsrF/DrsH-like family protein [Bacteroidota bacterium]MDP4233260.1 DsrE/DsrF/DrsH-like family protein [Bacteroidota bacterium]MDP4242120.1 DsrE/DsrF/DrsH-like family protein [Bacteroidota bacterium]MDP4289081.1 DsrE/DsrF/DrsH-like family protein [Bacteroidota bacterium]
MAEDKLSKVSIVVSHGSLEGIYPGLIMANGARMEGIEANLFFTFFGLYGILQKYNHKLRIATVGNPAMRLPDAKGFPMPTIMGAIPGMSAIATKMMSKEMEKLDIPPIPEFLEMFHDAGGKIYACKATVDMFHLTNDDFIPQLDQVLTVGEFYEKSVGAQIIFT